MKKEMKIIFVLAIVTMVWTTQVRAATIGFYEDGVLEDGDVYAYVGVYDDATVDMTGGVVTNQFTTWDSSIANVSGGILEALVSVGSSTLNLSDSMQCDKLEINNSSIANMFGGSVGTMEAWNYSTVNLHGGIISDYLEAYGDSSLVVNVYGYDFDYDPLAGDYDGGLLTGFWMDDTSFSIDLWYSSGMGAPTIDTWSHVVLVPEPATVLMFGLGMFLARKRRC